MEEKDITKKFLENLVKNLKIITSQLEKIESDLSEEEIIKIIEERTEKPLLDIYVNLGEGKDKKMYNLTQICHIFGVSRFFIKRSEIKKITGLNGEELSNRIYRKDIDKMRNEQNNDSYISIDVIPLIFEMVKSKLKKMDLEFPRIDYKAREERFKNKSGYYCEI